MSKRTQKDLLLKMVRQRKQEADRARERFLRLESEMQRAKSEYESLKFTAEKANYIVQSFIASDDFDLDELFNI